MIFLPNRTRERAIFRVLIMRPDLWATQSWTPLPQPAIYSRASGQRMAGTVAQGGYHVQFISRWCLPDEDRAAFFIDYGRINNTDVAAPDPMAFSGAVARIQVLDDETFPGVATDIPSEKWKTVFIGHITHISHKELPGVNRSGRATCYCSGIIDRLDRWPLDRHSTAATNHAKGHPGYNYPLHGWFRKVLGNKGADFAADPFTDLVPPFDAYYKQHALPVDGSGSETFEWTDEDAVRHALVSSRAKGEMLINALLNGGLFDGVFSWRVTEGDTCATLLKRICNRNRGRGACYFDYIDDDPNGDVSIYLFATSTVAPTTVGTPAFTYNVTDPATPGTLEMTQPKVVPIAELGVDAIDFDLVGDHRLTPNGFTYTDRSSARYDSVIVQGERIQVCCNLNFFGSSLTKRWSDADQTAFDAIPANLITQRTVPRWAHVWRRFGIPDAYTLTVTPVPGGDAASIDYAVDGLGTVTIDPVTGGTSAFGLRVLPDLPIYEGWRYDGAVPARYDGAADYLPPDRMSPVVMYRGDENASGDPTWLPLQNAQFNLRVDDFGLYIVHPLEDQFGYRFLANPTDAEHAFEPLDTAGVPKDLIDTTSGLDLLKLNTIVGVELSTRVAIWHHVGDNNLPIEAIDTMGRRLVLNVDGVHLWLGAPGAVWELDYTRAALENYAPGLQFPATDDAYVIRDDRNQLALIAALAWDYHGRDHNPCVIELRDCGLLTSYQSGDTTIDYPMVGQLLNNVFVTSSVTVASKTPITSVHYDHDTGTTVWRTDYVAYDGNTQ
jgi:hypothetical protein